jgi:prophage antirepressor-like protein
MTQIFQFEGHEIRFVEGKPVANDVAAVLGYADPVNTIRKKVKSKNKGVAKMPTPGGLQQVTVLEEAGIYQLIFSSKLPSAEKFQDWVFEKVLPEIRKTGSFNSKPDFKQIYADRLLNNKIITPEKYWAVFSESHLLLLYVEQTLRHPVDKFDLLDGSVGIRWANYRKDKEWALESGTGTIIFNDKRNTQIIRCYQYPELTYFRWFLEDVYIPLFLEQYLADNAKRKNKLLNPNEQNLLS